MQRYSCWEYSKQIYKKNYKNTVYLNEIVKMRKSYTIFVGA